MKEVLISTIDLLDPNEGVVETAQEVAARVVAIQEQGHVAKVSLKGIKGVSSSFFNEILHALRITVAVPAPWDQLSFEFDSELQQKVYDRSRAAFLRSLPSA
jgi:hypothetical protein